MKYLPDLQLFHVGIRTYLIREFLIYDIYYFSEYIPKLYPFSDTILIEKSHVTSIVEVCVNDKIFIWHQFPFIRWCCISGRIGRYYCIVPLIMQAYEMSHCTIIYFRQYEIEHVEITKPIHIEYWWMNEFIDSPLSYYAIHRSQWALYWYILSPSLLWKEIGPTGLEDPDRRIYYIYYYIYYIYYI